MGKYNEGKKHPIENYQKSSIWKYLHEDIDDLLASEMDDKHRKATYVPCKEIEDMLSSLLKYSKEHRYFVLSGLTGIGKTTIMRHVFFSDKAITTPIIKDRNLIIPIDFDSFIEPSINDNNFGSFEEMYIRVFSQAAVTVQQKFNLPMISDDDFVTFFEEKHSGIINYIDKNGNRNSKTKMRQDVYKDSNCRIYAVLAELCLFLNHQNCNIKNVILIVDNIESLGIYRSPIEIPLLITHKAVNFMCNKSVIKKGRPKWVPNILICCRHYVYRIMHSRNHNDGSLSQIFESFSKPIYVDLDSSVPLDKIINKRYEAYTKLSKTKNTKRTYSMSVVYTMLTKIIEETNINNSNIVLDLNLSDFRSTLKTLKDIVYNKPWIQRDDFEDNGSFAISDLSDFNCKLSNILRAIGMKSGNVYNSEDNLIPNLLSNTPDNIANIYDLITLKYFMSRSSSWRTPLSISDFNNIICEIFDGNFAYLKERFNTAIWHLLKNRMLLRSADQEQQDVSSITHDNYNEIEYVYVSSAAKDYWTLLGENSTILEMLMDDIYIDESKYDIRTERQTKYRIFNKDSFLLALLYLSDIYECEKKLIKNVIDSNKTEAFCNCFGNDLITEHLLKGLSSSFSYYFRDKRKSEEIYINKCEAMIEKIRSKVNHLKQKF